ncbi:MAG: hypothetical protein KJ659_01770 [Actinobacteria bacterium]|nr:hypothetical protein [Actinomycetota bacterium]MBU1607735.1 hypothetical protein [Actinomycetota bacterium]MBU2314589.1 hypothetical protein [Actinomycetota bacterium]MBU2384216.1 hypothetical protein [Actinomycetota bacterium]
MIDDLVETDSFGILTTELRRLEADGHNIDHLLPRIIRAGGLEDVEDLGSLLRFRIQKVTASYPASSRQAPGQIVGLVPRATGIADPVMRQALEEREQLMQHRLDALTQAALEHAEPWVTALDIADPAERQSMVQVVVAYRDRWGITSTSPLGPVPADDAQRIDYERTRTTFTTRTQATPADVPGRSRQAGRAIS